MKSEASAALALLPSFDIPTITVQENGTYGDKAKPSVSRIPAALP
jgi:hypothetical protein